MKALEYRKQLKAKKPRFATQDSHKHKEISARWRRPKGMHSKMRLHKKSKPRGIDKGFRSPREVRHLDPSGLEKVMVDTADDLSNLKQDEQIVEIRSGVGSRKRIELLTIIMKQGLKITNIKDAQKAIEALKAKKEKKKKARETALRERKSKKAAKAK